MQAKKALGQNFLNNDTIIDKIVSLFVCNKNDLVIEIGPGRGALTKKLLTKPGQKLGIEVDNDMQPYLDKMDIDILYTDILQVDLSNLLKEYQFNDLYILGNLPYYITSPILEKLIKAKIKAKKMIFMVQNEVAKRLSAMPGAKEYGYMTVFVNHFYDVNYEFLVTKENFNPVPKVDSAIISLNAKDYLDMSEEYFSFLKTCFQHKRKTLINNLASYDKQKVINILNKYNLTPNARAEDLKEDVFLDLFANLSH